MNNEFKQWLYGRMRVMNIRQVDIAKQLNLTQQAISYKIRYCRFNYEELLIIFKMLQADSETICRLLSLSASA